MSNMIYRCGKHPQRQWFINHYCRYNWNFYHLWLHPGLWRQLLANKMMEMQNCDTVWTAHWCVGWNRYMMLRCSIPLSLGVITNNRRYDCCCLKCVNMLTVILSGWSVLQLVPSWSCTYLIYFEERTCCLHQNFPLTFYLTQISLTK